MYNVYEIVCTPNSRKYYGRSQEVEKRWRSHRNMLRKNEHSNIEMQNDWNEFGEDAFRFNIIETFTDIDASIAAEQTLIDDSMGISYNISNAKAGGDTFTNNPRREEIRALHSLQTSGERNPMYGREKSPYTLQRIKEANSKPVIIDGTRYESLTQASRTLNVKQSTVSFRLNSESERFRTWVYVDRGMPNDYRNHAG